MGNRPGQKIKLTSIDELLCVPQTAGTTDVDVNAIYPFENHPFKVLDDEKMEELVDSIKLNGILTPVIVRPDDEGTYEMISGHRRLHAAKRAGLQKIPAIVKEMTNDDAILAMVDSNLQREEILPSEKAFAYKMRLDAMNRQGKRTDLTYSPVGNKSERTTSHELSEQVGDSKSQIFRYIRLTELIPELLDMVDEGQIAMRPAVEISYLPKELQEELLENMEIEACTPSHDQAMRMKGLFKQGKLTPEVISAIMQEEKPNQREKVILRDERTIKLLPRDLPVSEREEYILKALEHYGRYLRKQRDLER